jgi:RimJ/RimL family protein N-acetyltransferase
LLSLLVKAANNEKIERLSATIMAENLEMRHVAEKLGFKISQELTDSTLLARLNLAEGIAKGNR